MNAPGRSLSGPRTAGPRLSATAALSRSSSDPRDSTASLLSTNPHTRTTPCGRTRWRCRRACRRGATRNRRPSPTSRQPLSAG
eukprot:4685830-Alexandrium_andersonii.AAC.1